MVIYFLKTNAARLKPIYVSGVSYRLSYPLNCLALLYRLFALCQLKQAILSQIDLVDIYYSIVPSAVENAE